MTVIATEQTIRLGFAILRDNTHPRLHRLIGTLEAYMLDLQDATDEIRELTQESATVVPLDMHSRRV